MTPLIESPADARTISATVFIIDDDEHVRFSLQANISAAGFSSDTYSSAEEFLLNFDPTTSGCIVADVRMSGMTGIEMLEELRARKATIPVIIISGHADIQMGLSAMKLGAVDFLEKPFVPGELREAIGRAIEADHQQRQSSAARADAKQALAKLTDEERQVSAAIAVGKTNKVIANELSLSLRTIQFRRASAMKKLGVENRAELVRLFLSLQSQD